MSESFSKKRQVDEIRRCARDPIYFMNSYAKISHPQHGPLLFKTFPFQDDCVKAFLEHKFNIINKSRQLGLSTLAAAYAAWLLLFHRNKEIIIMATKLQVAQNFIKKVKFVVKNLPHWLVLPKIEKDNERSLVFGNPSNSRIEAIPTAADAGRSEALSLLIVDEAAHVSDFEELWKGLWPTLSTGGRALIISTPRGTGNWFHKLWVDAQDGTNEFNPIRLPWDVHPERDEEWFASQTANMSTKGIAQELLCDFLASGDTYFEPEDIEWVGKMIREPLRKAGVDRNVWIWEEPNTATKYIMSADVGRGDSNDNSAFHVLDTFTGHVAAEYRGKLRPDHFAQLLFEFGKLYNNALLCPERNVYGHHVLVELVNKGYTNIYFKNPRGVFLGTYIPPDKISEAGFDTQAASRKQIISKLEEVIRNRQIQVYSLRFHLELKTFIIHHDKPQAQKNCHDDLVMSLAIAAWLFDTDNVNSQHASTLNKAMLQSFNSTVTKFESFNNTAAPLIIAPGAAVAAGYLGSVGDRKVVPRDPRDPRRAFRWLL